MKEEFLLQNFLEPIAKVWNNSQSSQPLAFSREHKGKQHKLKKTQKKSYQKR